MENLDKIIKELSELSTEQLIRVSEYVEKMKAEADVRKEIEVC